jgi:pilus assembly protein Flp/PilA
MMGYDKMTNFISEFVRDESGAAAAEYALILAIVGAGIAGAAFYLGGKISTSMKATGDKVATCAGAGGGGTGC